MNIFSMLNDLSIWDKIGALFDTIPKIVYFLYASFASAVDAMQMLVRRICGLDVYYTQNSSGDWIENFDKDPLTEFINGILGIGDNAGAYQALNTTFWSLAIFALILLSVSSIVAIIKAHYNEDTGKTSPVKILYNSFKAIVTFAIVPFAIIIGLQLSSLFLRTLDDITATSATEEALVGIYGNDAVTNFFVPKDERQGEDSSISQKIYSSYDMFGYGAASTNTPISGLLFKAASYNANRFRNYDYSTNQVLFSLKSGQTLFGNSNSPGFNSAEDKREYIAYQVDYAFINNLNFQEGYKYTDLVDEAMSTGSVAIWDKADLFSNSMFDSFSKYNVSFVWLYYNLWQFNFIIAFAGACATFGIMTSIIIGLMMRLIKSAAMFLIYPPLLGLAPIDDFKAFKSWANDFIKQVLSSYGAIIGLNLLFLILPYIQSISFFNLGMLDAIVNLVFLVTGLIMAKDFISMVAGFVGGGDVFSTGDGAKGQVAGTLKKGVKSAVGIGLVPTKGIKTGFSMVTRGIKSGVASRKLKKQKEALDIYNKNKENYVTEKAEKAASDSTTAFAQSIKNNKDANNAYKDYLKSIGKNSTTATDEEKTEAYRRAEKVLYEKDESYKQQKDSDIQGSWEQGQLDQFLTKKDRKKGLNHLTAEQLQERMADKANSNYLNIDGTQSKEGEKAMRSNVTAGFRGAIKNLFSKDMLSNIGLDKLTATVKELSGVLMSKDADGNPLAKTKQYSANSFNIAEEREKVREKGIKEGRSGHDLEQYIDRAIRDKIKTETDKGAIKDAIVAALKEFGNTFISGANKAPEKEKISSDKIGKEQLKKTEETNKKIDSLADQIKDLVSVLKSKP